eukprot:1137663-Pelagomonas_calceolata.AAC.7
MQEKRMMSHSSIWKYKPMPTLPEKKGQCSRCRNLGPRFEDPRQSGALGSKVESLSPRTGSILTSMDPATIAKALCYLTSATANVKLDPAHVSCTCNV